MENNFHFTAWRLANFGDKLHFKFETEQDYYGQSGYRRWQSGAAAGSNAAASGNTDFVKFMFDDANSNLLGLSVLTAALLTIL